MALWLTALKVLPWGDMIEYAPKVVSGAQKVWQRVKTGKDGEVIDTTMPLSADPQTEAQLLRQEIQQLQTQQLDLSNLMKQLADQNQRLVEAVNVLRVRTRMLLVGSSIALIAVIALALRAA